MNAQIEHVAASSPMKKEKDVVDVENSSDSQPWEFLPELLAVGLAVLHCFLGGCLAVIFIGGGCRRRPSYQPAGWDGLIFGCGLRCSFCTLALVSAYADDDFTCTICPCVLFCYDI